MPKNPPHFHSVSHSDYSPVGILHPHARSQNGAMPHWCWISDYTPFGFGMPERSYTSTAAGYRWGFQAQDPRIGRFFALDPLEAEYPFYSPYAFSGNRVIDYKKPKF
jgi:hypothetical protein